MQLYLSVSHRGADRSSRACPVQNERVVSPWTVKPVVKVTGLTKRFAGMTAVDHVDFEVGQNEIHALIGENGAGKSTLCKMLTGLYSVDEGTIEILGEKKVFHTPADSIRAGIGMLYQERNLVPFLTAAENISLGYEAVNGLGMIDNKELMKRAAGAT